MNITNPKLMLAGAAIGAYTQDPTEHPVAGVVGMGIGAYVGNSIKAEVIAKTNVAKVQSENIRVDLDKVGRADPTFEKFHRAINKRHRQASRFSNSAEVKEGYIRQVAEMYKNLGGEVDIGPGNSRYVQMMLNAGSAKGSVAENMPNLAKEVFGDSEQADLFLTANKLVTFNSESVQRENGKGFDTIGVVKSNYDKMSNEGIGAKRIAINPSSELSISGTKTVAEREEVIKQYLIENLYYPESAATKEAANIALLTDGNDISLHGSKLKVVGQDFGPNGGLELDQYDKNGQINVPYQVSKNGDLYASKRHNQLLGEGLGRNIGATVAVTGEDGSLVRTSVIDKNVKQNTFSSATASLLEWNLNGKKDDLKDIAQHYSNARERIGNFEVLRKINEHTPENLNMALAQSKITDASRQMYIDKNGRYYFREISHTQLQDISSELEVLKRPGYMNTYEGVGINAVNDINIGNKIPESRLHSAITHHQERATDSRLNRRKGSVSSNDALRGALAEAASEGLDTSQYGGANLFKVKGVNESVNSITNYIGNGSTLADGQTIMREDALHGTSVRGAFTVKVKDFDQANMYDLTDGDFSFDALTVSEGQDSQTRFRGGQTLAVGTDGSSIKVPEYFTDASLRNVYVNNDGETVFNFEGEYSPRNSRAGAIKIFGDTKSNALQQGDDLFKSNLIFSELENRGLLNPATGASEEVLEALNEMGFKLKSNDYENIGEAASHMTKEELGQLARRFNIDDNADLLIRAGDSKLEKTISSAIRDTGSKTIEEAKNAVNSIESTSNLKSVFQNMLDGSNTKARSGGVLFAIEALTNGKSSQTAMATVLMDGIEKTLQFGDEGYEEYSKEIAKRMKEYSKLVELSEAGDINAQRKLAERLVETGERQILAGRSNIYTTAAIDTPVPDTVTPSASWMQTAEMRAQFGGDQIAEVMLNEITSVNHSANYETKALLSGYEDKGKTFTEVFGDDPRQAKETLGKIFKTGSDVNRAEVVKDLIGEVPEDGILNIKLSRSTGELVNIPLTLYNTNRSGVFDQNGQDMLPVRDKAFQKVLQQEAILAEAKKKGQTDLIPMYENNLDESIAEAESIIKQMEKNLAKEAGKRVPNSGADLVMLATGGKNAEYWQKMADQGRNVVFVNKEGAAAMGIDVNAREGDKQFRYKQREEGISGQRLTMDKEGKFPVMFNLGREPVAGSNSNFQAEVIYDSRLDDVNRAAVFFTENAIDKDDKVSRVMLANADFDDDKMRTMDISNLMEDETYRGRVAQNMEDYLRSFAGAEGEMNSALLAKAKAADEEIQFRMEQANAVAKSVTNRFKGQERKNMAPKVTELAQIISDSVRQNVNAKVANINTKYGINSTADIKGLDETTKVNYNRELEEVRVLRRRAMSVDQFYLENTLKAIHGKGGSGSEVENIIDTLKAHRVTNTKSEEAAKMVRQSIMDTFGGNAKNISDDAYQALSQSADFIAESIRDYGGTIATDPNRMVGGEGQVKSLRAAARHMPQGPEILPEQAFSATIRNTQDETASLIQSVKNNRLKVFGGLAALGATSFVMGSETPDVSSPIANSPVARTNPVLPPIDQSSGYVTSSINRNRAPEGSITINGSPISDYGDDGFKRRISNMFNGNSAGRTTVRYQNNESY